MQYMFNVMMDAQRTVADILMREQLEAWQEHYGEAVFKVIYSTMTIACFL